MFRREVKEEMKYSKKEHLEYILFKKGVPDPKCWYDTKRGWMFTHKGMKSPQKLGDYFISAVDFAYTCNWNFIRDHFRFGERYESN